MERLITTELIGSLQEQLRQQIAELAAIRSLNENLLLQRPTAEQWSIVEICEHLNLSSGHYFKLLKKIYSDPKNNLHYKEHFKPGRFGEMGVKAMQPTGEGRINWKMKTLGMFEPRTASEKGVRRMDELRSMLEGMIALLEKARERGLEGEKITSTLGPILRFKAGDAFRFPIAHQQRHFLQMQRTLEQLRITDLPRA